MSIKQHNLGGCSVGATDGSDFKEPVEMVSKGMKFIPSFVKIVWGIQAIMSHNFM
jgi:hypothetical protein